MKKFFVLAFAFSLFGPSLFAGPQFKVVEDAFNSLDLCKEFKTKVEEKVPNTVFFCSPLADEKTKGQYMIVATLKENAKLPIDVKYQQAGLKYIEESISETRTVPRYFPDSDQVKYISEVVKKMIPKSKIEPIATEQECNAYREQVSQAKKDLIYSRCVLSDDKWYVAFALVAQ